MEGRIMTEKERLIKVKENLKKIFTDSWQKEQLLKIIDEDIKNSEKG